MLVTGTSKIELFRLLALRGALSLECKGLKKRGRSAYSIVKSEFGFKGSKQRVLEQLEAYISQQKENHDDHAD